MTGQAPRVAFFPDSFHEVNGVAHTSRQFQQFAETHNLPFLCVRAGERRQPNEKRGSVWTLELPRSTLSLPLENDLSFDPAYLRHAPAVNETLEKFSPDIVHITGPSELGLMGAWLARHNDIPLAASWHTNVHEYAGRRFAHLLRVFPQMTPVGAAQAIEDCAMKIAARFYSTARVLYAPNQRLCSQLEDVTGRKCLLMTRGVDCTLFDPAKRERQRRDGNCVLGFVGRLSVEKNVRVLARIQRELEEAGFDNFRFLIVGRGSEEEWLRRKLPRAKFTGVLHGEALAAACADMDLLVFPSHTDTFGNVVLEALASGVPAIVTKDGGPSSIVRDGETGRIVPEEDFASAIRQIIEDTGSHFRMRIAARRYAMTATWDSVFEDVYRGYSYL